MFKYKYASTTTDGIVYRIESYYWIYNIRADELVETRKGKRKEYRGWYDESQLNNDNNNMEEVRVFYHVTAFYFFVLY